jgi:putative redox protein
MKYHLSLLKATIQEKYYTESKVRGFTILSDEPETIGGTNKAPSPIDLMNAALASCTLMYLKNKADIENIAVGEIRISIKVTKNEIGSFTFERNLSFQNPLSDTEKESLLRHSNNTPVTRALSSQSIITTKFK